MKRVLVVSWSQTGQLDEVVSSVIAPLQAAEHITVEHLRLQLCQPLPFPWPFLDFFDTFPETVYGEPAAIQPVTLQHGTYDLVILAYQVWFLSPSQPIMAFLNSDAARVLKNTPVMTLIVCRNMWLMAQEVMKQRLHELGARLIDNVVLTDRAHPAATFISTPMWLLTGRRGPFLGGWIPAAGIPPADSMAARRFGDAIVQQLPHRTTDDNAPMLQHLRAVQVNERLIASERVAKRSFLIWGALLRRLGKPGARQRRVVLCVYVVFLVMMILTVVPVSAVIKRLLAPWQRERIAQERAYFAAPSGGAG